MLKIILITFLFITSCSTNEDVTDVVVKKSETEVEQKLHTSNTPKNRELKVELIGSITHSYDSYTQGLFFDNGFLYESTGEYTKSKLYKINPNNGEIINSKKLPLMIFAEGSDLYNDDIYVLTWKEGFCLVYEKNTFTEKNRFQYNGEGWGLTSDNQYFYMTNGSNKIYVRDKSTFLEMRRIPILDNNLNPYNYLNELEYINGEIWANVWMQDVILRINPQSGEVIQKIDLSFLRQELKNNSNAEVLNGIAYDSKNGIYYVTGKNWNKIFKLKFN